MDLKEFLEHLNSGKTVLSGSEVHKFMHKVSSEAMRITAELNCRYHEPEEINQLFSKLIGKEVDPSFRMFPPFYSDCGKNINVGKMYLLTPDAVFRIRAELLSVTEHS